MAQKKYQVFVSSTFRDLVEERQAAIRSVLDANQIPAGMELFPAADIDQLDYIKKVIDECDYYILIMGGRYGSMDAAGVSYTEREYDYAVDTGRTVLAFVHSDPDAIPLGKSDVDPDIANALKSFREKVMEGRLVKRWSSKQELGYLVATSLMHAISVSPQVGWIRGNNAASETLLEESNAILKENAILKARVTELESEVGQSIDDIADLDDLFAIRYTEERLRSTRIDRYKRTIKLTWRQLFLALAGKLTVPKTSDIMISAIKEAVREAGCSDRLGSINETDIVTIKVQLQAHGLISASAHRIFSAALEEFIALTNRGRAQFIQDRVVRRVDDN